jgi:drug/metabolite transporter (DMT)-like permease
MTAYGIMLACALVYACVPVMTKALRPCPPFLLIGLASSIEAVFAGLAATASGQWPDLRLADPAFLAIAAGAIVSVTGAWLVIRGYEYMPIWRHQLFILLKPLVAAFAAWLWFGETVGWEALPAFLLMSMGLLIAFNALRIGGSGESWSGLHILVGASSFYALLPVCLKAAVGVVPPLAIVSLLAAGIAVLSLGLSMMFERNVWIMNWNRHFLWKLPMLGSTNALAVWLSVKGLELLPVWQHQLILLSKPVLAALFARLVFSEPLTRRYGPAFVFMAGGAALLIVMR